MIANRRLTAQRAPALGRAGVHAPAAPEGLQGTSRLGRERRQRIGA